MKILNLTLKKQWFDLIAAGTKKEEYREIKGYWAKRLLTDVESKNPVATLEELLVALQEGDAKSFSFAFQHFDVIRFKNGYAADAPEITVEYKGARIQEGKTEWGAVAGKKYFTIILGQILKPVNL